MQSHAPSLTQTRSPLFQAPPAPQGPRAEFLRTWARRGLAVAAVSAPAAVVYWLLASGLLGAPVGLLLGSAVLVLAPSAPDLARRVALNGSVFVGWVATTWWVRWPLPVNHGALAVATAVAVVFIVAAMSSGHRGGRLSRLRPRVAAADLLLPLAALVSATAMWRWALPSSPRAALVALLPGADNYAHFHMFSTLRTYGATTQTLETAPDGSAWAFNMYPQGFHAVAATLSELIHPHLVPGPESLVAYTQAVALVVVLGIVVLTSAILSVTGLRERPLVAVPVVICTWTAFLWRPGQDVLADGFANFWLAALTVGIALLLSLAPSRRPAVPHLLAVAGLLVLVAHAWAPLLVVGGPALWAVLLPLREVWSGLRAGTGMVFAILAAAGLGVSKALLGLFSQVDVGTLVRAFGGIHGTNPIPAFVLVVSACYLCLAAPSLVRRRGIAGADDTSRRARVLLLTPVGGITLGTALLVSQLRTVGTTSYYFVKFFIGFELVLAALVPALFGFVLVSMTATRRRHPGRMVAAGLAAAVATQAFGAFPGAAIPLFEHDRAGTASVKAPYSADRMADGILAAVRTSAVTGSFGRDYLAIGRDGAAEAFYPDGWYHGVGASLSLRSGSRVDLLRRHVDDMSHAVPLARRLLEKDPNLEILVGREYAPALRKGLGIELAGRVRSVQPQGER